ncbi:MAG TPA: NADH-quinone oxidoreductase subunit J [Streptosporangiaceae bacterium]|nr:NADH-quinone oxidoreductase subunit J [Streptosporangiaceae bacterium]
MSLSSLHLPQAAAAAGHLLAAAPSPEGPAPTTHAVIFWLFTVIAVAGALGMVLARRAVHCAMMLATVMFSLAVLYLMQGAPFLAFAQVIVYTGAVLMLFLFVLMLISVSSAESLAETLKGQRVAALVAGLGMVILLALAIGHAAIGQAKPMTSIGGTGNVTGLAALIFTRYVFPFEVTSALLITAALGAMVLAHRERTRPKPTQRELSRRRIASGHPTPLPPPGVYALHDAVDMPALLPDGTPCELSVSPAIARREPGPATPAIAAPGETPAPREDGPGGDARPLVPAAGQESAEPAAPATQGGTQQ